VRILETDTCIELLRGNRTVLERRAAVLDVVVTTWVSAAELYFGAALSTAPDGNRTLVDDFLRSTAVVDMDSRAARIFGETKALLQRKGEIVPDADLLIGAIALARGATLVTGNSRHFARMPGLQCEDWIRA
jgi:tRNA(fMet)-specific endonuclease VapC